MCICRPSIDNKTGELFRLFFGEEFTREKIGMSRLIATCLVCNLPLTFFCLDF